MFKFHYRNKNTKLQYIQVPLKASKGLIIETRLETYQ